MKLFSPIYEKVMQWAAHRHAERYLAGMSFAESSFFPIPVDVMLAPMALAQPHRAWRFAGLATITSVLGGIAGYLIGMFAFELIEPLLHSAGYWARYEMTQEWFTKWGVWVIFIAGFSPIPYKIFTISAGVIGMAMLPFVIASVVGRGARFYLVSGLMVWGGARMEAKIRQYVDYLGWTVVALLIIGYFLYF
ncbi:MAG: DedA family protein [Gammaproteobacteria bacterium]|nr:DedA family protein [Gammaproteobacteria bacterium]MDH5777862.1 DedA family protein [Gammaproteobacteria bacterium]